MAQYTVMHTHMKSTIVIAQDIQGRTAGNESFAFEQAVRKVWTPHPQMFTDDSKARFTIWHIAPSCCAASCPAATIEMESILAARRANATYCELSLKTGSGSDLVKVNLFFCTDTDLPSGHPEFHSPRMPEDRTERKFAIT